MNTIPGFYDRMIQERSELLDKIRALADSLDDERIDGDQRIWMMQQLGHMAGYAAALQTRVTAAEAMLGHAK